QCADALRGPGGSGPVVAGRQGLLTKDAPVARRRELASEPPQLGLQLGQGIPSQKWLEQRKRRAQTTDRDTHLMDADSVASFENRRLMLAKLGEATARNLAERGTGAIAGSDRRRRLGGCRSRATTDTRSDWRGRLPGTPSGSGHGRSSPTPGSSTSPDPAIANERHARAHRQGPPLRRGLSRDFSDRAGRARHHEPPMRATGRPTTAAPADRALVRRASLPDRRTASYFFSQFCALTLMPSKLPWLLGYAHQTGEPPWLHSRNPTKRPLQPLSISTSNAAEKSLYDIFIPILVHQLPIDPTPSS